MGFAQMEQFLPLLELHWQRKLVIEEEDYRRPYFFKHFQVLPQELNLIHWFDAGLAKKGALESNCN
jgi:hypothetical protein